MPQDDCRSDCFSHAAQWRRRAAETAHAELREAYERIAESYERLTAQAVLCRRLVLARARQRGQPAPCACPVDTMVETS